MRTLKRAVAVTTLLSAVARAEEVEIAPSVRAERAATAVSIDGVLDDAAWTTAGAIGDLAQQSPHPGEPTPYRTEVRLLVDETNLYVGVTCMDPEPDRIAVHTLRRDGEMEGDDLVTLVLDTFGDRNTGYVFRVNAAGARADGLISSNGESLDWDAIWTARVTRGPDRWTAEIRIPARSLRFRGDSWGFNVERVVARDRVALRWAGATLDASLLDLRRAGSLEGVGSLHQGVGLSVVPYGVVRFERDQVEDRRNLLGQLGLDVSYNLGPDLAAVLTVNTDFAETEVDTRQVNLTRFPLFFPEKRAFFTEGANQFDFGLGIEFDFIPFFTRRIGLYDEKPVGLLGGLKLIGHAGSFGIGVLGVATKDEPGLPGSDLYAGRFTYDFADGFRAGVIGTSGDPDGVSRNQLVGADLQWKTSTFRGDKNMEAGAWIARTDGDVPDGSRSGFGAQVGYPNDLWNWFVTARQFGEGLDPALGFLPRPGSRWYAAGCSFQPRPEIGFFSTWIRQFFFELYPTYIEDLHGQVQSWDAFVSPWNVETQSGEHFEVDVDPSFEHLDEPFEIAEGVVIPAGDYRFSRYRAEAESSESRPWRIGASIWFGTFYTGRLVQLEPYARYTTPGGRVELAISNETDDARLSEGDFVVRLWQGTTVVAFSPDLTVTADVQYDSESRNLGLNTRLRWQPRSGMDVFLVYNRGWERRLGERGWHGFDTTEDEVALKVRYTWRR
ncbi:MAG: DUF5916 domain-containing protein [Acidobacteriota bacterium]